MPKKILLVEDEALIAMAEAQMLMKHGYAVVTAYNGKKAVEMADKDPQISLILMDIDLGNGMDGTEAAEEILTHKEIPIVFLSSHTEPKIVEKTEKLTSYGYVVKNSGATVLDASIKMALRLHEAKNEAKNTAHALRESEATIRKRLKAISEPEGDIDTLELADIIDAEELQTMMEDFYKLTGIGGAILDISGKILVGVAWQDICAKFHRVHPDTRKNCLESDLVLSKGVPLGTSKAYHCKNNMWDIVTPIMVNTTHLGNIYIGQFFFEDEDPDYELFRKQARQHGFDETAYIAALDRVPRLKRKTVDRAMTFYSRLAGMISSLSYTTIKLSRKIEQHMQAEKALKDGRDLLNTTQRIAGIGGWQWDIATDTVAWSEELYTITGLDPNFPPPQFNDDHHKIYTKKSWQKLTRAVERTRKTGEPYQLYAQMMRPDGELREVFIYGGAKLDHDGAVAGLFGVVEDITDKNQREKQLRESEENLRITLNSIGDAVISTDTEGAIIRMNPVAENLCGWSTGEAKGKALTEVFHIVHAETGEKVENPVAKVLETGSIVGLANHTMLISREGTEYQIADSAAPIIDDNGHTTGVVLVFRDVTEEYQKDRQLQERVRELRSIEWMLSNKSTQQEEYHPGYGDLSELNKEGRILYSAGKEQLKDIASEYLDLLETSTAIYEKDGSYALGIFTSGWCRLMDSASRKLCNTDDNREALDNGKWLCHESCWNVSTLAMSKDRPIEVTCNGGIRMYSVPVHACGETVGAINFGYGSPPTDEAELKTLSKKYKVPVTELRKHAHAYKPRPQFIIDYAKERIHVAAAQLGRILDRAQAEEALKEHNKTAHQFFSESAAGAFFMMIDQAVEWNDSVDKEKVLDYVFAHQRISQINTAMLDQYLAREEEFLGKTPKQLFAHDVEHGRFLWRKMFDQGFLSIDSNERRFDGSQLWIVGSYRCMYDEQGRITGHFGTQHDITELKRAEDTLREALKEKDYLMQELNHRVKNNLAMVSSLINLKDFETAADLSDLQHQIETIGLIHEKLNKTGSVTEIDCRDYFDDLLSSLFSSFTKRPVKIEANIDEISIPTKSAMSLGLLINEIATNAIKYGFSGEEEAVFSVNMKEDRENGRYELTLSNTGKPFPEDLALESTETLGLRLINALVAQIDGTMELQKKPQPVFTIRFPVEER